MHENKQGNFTSHGSFGRKNKQTNKKANKQTKQQQQQNFIYITMTGDI